MKQKRIVSIIGLLFAITGLVCIVNSGFQNGSNQGLLSIGVLCNMIALLIFLFFIKKKR